MRSRSLILLLLVGCAGTPGPTNDQSITTSADDNVFDTGTPDTPPTAPAISEAQAMQIAMTGLDSSIYTATSTITGPMQDDADQIIEVYEVTISGADQLVLRYVNDATGELLEDHDAWHDIPAPTEIDTGAPPPPSYYTSGCPSGWPLCIKSPSTITFYSQNDPSWACNYLGTSTYYTLGGSAYGATCSSHTMHSAGCLVSAYAMAICQNHGTCVNPGTLNTAGVAGGCFSGANLTLSGSPSAHKCITSVEGATNSQIYVTDLWSTIASGKAVVAFGYSSCMGSTHAQMIWGHDGSRYWTKDPWYDWANQDQSLCISSPKYYVVK